MGMKFLNKKGWHTGSLQNIEKVWKAEQKNSEEQKKLEQLRKQYEDERKVEEFRQLQQEAGITIRQERVEFLYDSGLASGKATADEYLLGKPIEEESVETPEISKLSATPGALLGQDAKPASANEMWRRIHSDPLFLIRQQEQEALAKIKSNPVKMQMLKQQAEMKRRSEKERKKAKKEEKKRKREERKSRKKEKKEKRHGSRKESSDSESDDSRDRKTSRDRKRRQETVERSASPLSPRNYGRKGDQIKESSPGPNSGRSHDPDLSRDSVHVKKEEKDQDRDSSHENRPKWGLSVPSMGRHGDRVKLEKEEEKKSVGEGGKPPVWRPSRHRAGKVSEEEKARRLAEMRRDAEEHEEERWQRLKRAEVRDEREKMAALEIGKEGSFIEEANKAVYGTGEGGSASVEESVRRRKFFSQRGSADGSGGNAFRR